MLTVRCKVLSQGDYSVVVELPETDIAVSKRRRSRRFVHVSPYLCIVARSLIYPLEVKEQVGNDTTKVLYFDNPLPEELDLVNDPDVNVFLQSPYLSSKIIIDMMNNNTDISYMTGYESD